MLIVSSHLFHISSFTILKSKFCIIVLYVAHCLRYIWYTRRGGIWLYHLLQVNGFYFFLAWFPNKVRKYARDGHALAFMSILHQLLDIWPIFTKLGMNDILSETIPPYILITNSNGNMVDAPTCGFVATPASLNLRSWNYVWLEIFEKFITFFFVEFKIAIWQAS